MDDIFSLPSFQQLLELEKTAKEKGSKIEIESLIGSWKFYSVWQKGKDNQDSLSSLILRLISANLDLLLDKKDEESMPLVIINSVKFILISIKFLGRAELIGDQPRLSFFFDFLEVRFGKIPLFNSSIDVPQKKDRPFFSLIALDEEGKWLASRGRGGGMAVWLKE